MADTAKQAPAQYKQPSRKGKKAWRKNVDVTEIHEGLEDVREEEITFGGVISEKAADELFAVDTTGSTDIQKDYHKKHKPLKADEILAQRSAIPAVSARKRVSDPIDDASNKRQKKGVSYKEYDRLRSIAYGGNAVHKDVVEAAEATYDPWAEAPIVANPQYTFLEAKRKKVEPSTLKHAPVALTASGKPVASVRKPKAGNSYNPLYEDWNALLEEEKTKEVEAERKRLQAAQNEADRMEKALATAAEPDPESDLDDEYESEWEGIQSDNEEARKLRQKRPERKTQAERNKIRRRKEAEALTRHEKKVAAKERQVAKVKAITAELARKEMERRSEVKVPSNVESEEEVDEDVALRRKRFGKVRVPRRNLEVVLEHELQDSLRRLRPEGNLLKDRFRNMQINGKIETRQRISMPKKRRVRQIEKWSYKDWDLSKK